MNFPFQTICTAAISLLPPKMDSREARAMLMAIGLQESRFMYRKQLGGPARGFWQFEQGGGVRGVIEHAATGPLIRPLLDRMNYDQHPATAYSAIADNDVLACVFARLLLWTVPGPLPGPTESQRAWEYYIEGWRPGKPHRSTWDAFYAQAWQET